ncbi:glycosyltransferase family 2 protein [Nitrosospira sp. NpAV]|uniref:glycosyltransferase family 2 protein n=1 Tax=Nitrosospira sp. NpAV TaxID=58133 RepID=UPI00059F870A|nr:glycosyltransferase family 2 protein [Nitrosospira sp. NpAV]KIO49289.1 hypothetical protein SQ11_06190 [Nitrosospira sp. NpAV]
MKLSASINFFNSEETLFQAVQCIRPYVDHLSIIYQEVSNYGHPISTEALNILEQLKIHNLVDDWIKYQPDLSLPATKNEFLKRREGLRIARDEEATHFLLMDADEFYLPSEFESAKNVIEEKNIDYSCVHSYFYVHKPTYRSLDVDTTNVCFIAKITDKLAFDFAGEFPAESVDPTRRISVPGGKFKFFDEHEICMHHMNFVRRDFISKLLNTSSAADENFIKQARNSLTSWRYPAVFSFPNKPLHQIIETENLFNLSESLYKSDSSLSPLDNSKDMHQKNILICTLWLRGFRGSEIVTYEVASWFAKQNWKVSIFTSEFEDPIAQEFLALGSNVVVFTDQTDSELIDIYPNLDFCWIHHQHLPESFIDFLAHGGKKPWMTFNHMSPYEQLEYPVVSAAEEKLADIILCNSQETLDVLRNYFSDSIDKIKLFQNPAPVDFYEAAQECDRTHSERLSRVVIVSNHSPAELKEAASLLQKNNVLVNFIGTDQHLTVRVTPNLLNNYDAVITIGKTVQYGLAIKKPIYIYDHFGGSGYLSKDNFQENEYYNFSGRHNEKKTGEQIADEIITNYLDARNFVQNLSNDQLKRFLLNDQLLILLNQSADYQKKIIPAEDFFEIDLIKAYSRNLSILLISNSSNNAIAAHNEQITSFSQILATQKEQITSLNQTIIETQRELGETRGELGDIRNTLARVFSSRSWKITRPLRVLNRAVHWRQSPPNRISNNFKILATSLRERGLNETVSKIAARLKVMTAISARVDESWITTSGARSTAQLPKTLNQPIDQTRKKITLISMIRNEKSIVEAFCAHALSLFDQVILIDHLSSDGTREYIKLLSEKHPSIEYFYFEEPGYYQSELMTWIARNVVDNEVPGWVFFLDADEFLPFRSREEFDHMLSKFRSFPIISMPWLNLVPLDMESGRVIDELFLKPPTPSFNCKIAFQPSLIPLDDYIVAQGNHALLMGDKFSQRLPVENAFPIYHLPIRTKHQLREKISHGVESYRRMGKDRTTDLGFHWDEINQIIETSSLTNEMMAGIASRYGDSLSPPYERDIDELREKGYSEMRMDVCFTQLMTSFCDIKLALDNEIKEETVSSTYTTSESEGSKKISLDPVTHTLRFSR